MTSWIDGSFVYSTKEAWVNAMRTFENGTFQMVGDPIMGMPPFNTQRIPMFNMPPPNVLKMQSPERMYRKSCRFFLNVLNITIFCIHPIQWFPTTSPGTTSASWAVLKCSLKRLNYQHLMQKMKIASRYEGFPKILLICALPPLKGWETLQLVDLKNA